MPEAVVANTNVAPASIPGRPIVTRKGGWVKEQPTFTFRDFDAANYLRKVEDMAPYLGACVEEAGDDAGVIAQALGAIA